MSTQYAITALPTPELIQVLAFEETLATLEAEFLQLNPSYAGLIVESDAAQKTADEAFKIRGALGGVINLDTLNTEAKCGVYHQVANANANAKPELNYPESMAGTLWVMMSAGITQMYIRYNTNNVWIRNNYGNKWSAWQRLATVAEVPKVAQTTGTSTTVVMSQKATTDSTCALGDEQSTATYSLESSFGDNMAAALTTVPRKAVITHTWSDKWPAAAIRFRPIIRTGGGKLI